MRLVEREALCWQLLAAGIGTVKRVGSGSRPCPRCQTVREIARRIRRPKGANLVSERSASMSRHDLPGALAARTIAVLDRTLPGDC